MKQKHKLQAKKRAAKGYIIRHREIYALAVMAAVVFGVLVTI